MLVIGILIPIAFVILNIWLWLFDNIFKMQENKIKIISITIIMGFISGMSIVMFPKIANLLGYLHLDFTQQNNNFREQIRHFGIYLSILILLFKLIISKFRFSKVFIVNSIIFALIFIIIGFVGHNNFTETAIKYYIFVALGEEFIKFFLGVSFFEKYKIADSDIIIFSVLSGIGFAFVENFVYVYSIYTNNEMFLQRLFGGLSVLITRGIVGFGVHTIFTGNIGLFNSFGLKGKIIFWSSFGALFGIVSHYFYDLLLFNGYSITILFTLIFGYFWISYLFYNSDRLFVNEGMKYVYY